MDHMIIKFAYLLVIALVVDHCLHGSLFYLWRTIGQLKGQEDFFSYCPPTRENFRAILTLTEDWT